MISLVNIVMQGLAFGKARGVAWVQNGSAWHDFCCRIFGVSITGNAPRFGSRVSNPPVSVNPESLLTRTSKISKNLNFLQFFVAAKVLQRMHVP